MTGCDDIQRNRVGRDTTIRTGWNGTIRDGMTGIGSEGRNYMGTRYWKTGLDDWAILGIQLVVMYKLNLFNNPFLVIYTYGPYFYNDSNC